MSNALIILEGQITPSSLYFTKFNVVTKLRLGFKQKRQNTFTTDIDNFNRLLKNQMNIFVTI